MSESFERMLTGGHPNSLGRTEDVVALILEDRARLDELYQCYFSADEVVRLRVSSAMKRVTKAHPEWTLEFMDGLQSEIAAIDQASTQWTLALLFDLTRPILSRKQRTRAVAIMKNNLIHHQDWIVLNNSMQVLFDWRDEVKALSDWLAPELRRLSKDPRKSVAKRAKKLLDQLA
ncbi:MAG: hypothetical protein AB8G23_23780 [Myxococcota bacterium]